MIIGNLNLLRAILIIITIIVNFDYFFVSYFSFSSLRSVIEKPPIGGKELLPLTSVQLAGFRLHPGPVRYSYIALKYIQSIRIKNKILNV